MAFTVKSKARAPGDSVYYDPKFRTLLETHIPMLRGMYRARAHPVSPDLIHKYEGDFYGLLGELNVSMDLYWVYLRINRMEHPHQFGEQLRDPYVRKYGFNLILPPREIFDDLRMKYLTTLS